MNETDTRFTGSIPETYDRFMGPMFFVPYAADDASMRAFVFTAS